MLNCMKIGFSDKMNIRYLAADRIGVEDTYQKSLDGRDQIGVRCEYAFFIWPAIRARK